MRHTSGRWVLAAAMAALVLSLGADRSPAMPDAALRSAYRRPTSIPYPADDPYSEAKAELGRKLFYDPRLSGPGNVACANCHNPGLAWGDGRAKAIGVGGELKRRSPTLLDLAWGTPLMWTAASPPSRSRRPDR